MPARRVHQLLAAQALRRRVERLRPPGTALCLGSVALGPGWKVTQGAGGPLPYADRSFDAVVALDALGRLPWRERPAVLHELARVSRGHVVVATRLPALDVIVPLRAWGAVRARVVGRPRWPTSYRVVVVAEIAASISASSSPASAS